MPYNNQIPHPTSETKGLVYDKFAYSGLLPWHIDESLSTTSSVASITSGIKIPARSLVLGSMTKCTTVATITTGTNLGIGVSGDLDKFGSVTLTSIDAIDDEYLFLKDGKAPDGTTMAPTDMYQTAASSFLLSALDNDAVGAGATSGTLDTGAWSVRIWGVQIQNFKDNS